MNQFTEEQLKELETIFGLKRVEPPKKNRVLPIEDGEVEYGEFIWWKHVDGPVRVLADNAQGTWRNIENFPNRYSHAKPEMHHKVVYYYPGLEGEE